MDLPVRAAASDETMELYAAGFNAWSQLTFESSLADEEPDDLFTFAKVLADKKLGRIVPEMTYTAVQRQDTWAIAGSSPDTLLHHEQNKRYLFDLPSGISGDGKVLTVQDLDSSPSTQVIVQYPSLTAWRAGKSTDTWPCKSLVRQIAAYDTGFVILLEDETVLSCGDPRFRDCIGRDVDESCPANVPGIILELSHLGEPIKKVAAGGYTVAALTESGALYLWGMETPGSQSRHNAFPHLNELPNYFEVDGEKDVQDVAIGESHAIALTTDGCIYLVGDNTNGQIGLGKDTKAPVGSWSKIDFTPAQGWEVVAVEAGPRSSFIVTAKSKQSQSSE
ncbi:putative E3 ubiquitin-protein ligase HERC6 [Fusarium austroafricanum]|uniref:Putative E3 ubiquitin-protein ligase HERC6 n=1 Tax=Fusarium austroafricanum TaxID=2364996 RepID=A0A8H4P815_9HYPO|nr:putative E3 ubiquitin-protein ligase HERC6 [Fusarium austroafricanum]